MSISSACTPPTSLSPSLYTVRKGVTHSRNLDTSRADELIFLWVLEICIHKWHYGEEWGTEGRVIFVSQVFKTRRELRQMLCNSASFHYEVAWRFIPNLKMINELSTLEHVWKFSTILHSLGDRNLMSFAQKKLLQWTISVKRGLSTDNARLSELSE